MKKSFRLIGLVILALLLVLALTACGQRTAETDPTPTPTPTVEVTPIAVETPPPSPTPTPTPTPSTPPVAVTTVPMPMPSVSPTVAITTTPDPAASDGTGTSAGANGTAVNTSPSPAISPSPSASPTPSYSAEASFASTIQPDGVYMPENTVKGYINTNGATFRGAANNSGRVLGTFEAGTAVEILGKEGNWTEVLYNNTVGYVLSSYVTAGSDSGSSVVVSGNDATGIGSVIIPDGSYTVGNNGTASSGTVTTTPDPGYFLGIMPD